MSAWNECREQLPHVGVAVLAVIKGDVRIAELLIGESCLYWDDPLFSGQGWRWCDVTKWAYIPE